MIYKELRTLLHIPGRFIRTEDSRPLGMHSTAATTAPSSPPARPACLSSPSHPPTVAIPMVTGILIVNLVFVESKRYNTHQRWDLRSHHKWSGPMESRAPHRETSLGGTLHEDCSVGQAGRVWRFLEYDPVFSLTSYIPATRRADMYPPWRYFLPWSSLA